VASSWTITRPSVSKIIVLVLNGGWLTRACHDPAMVVRLT
jgi:hypothetical protein